MLKLTRKVGESVVIHHNVYCTVESYSDREVGLVFYAPRTIPIHRDEIERKILLAEQQSQLIKEDIESKETVIDKLIRKFNYE